MDGLPESIYEGLPTTFSKRVAGVSVVLAVAVFTTYGYLPAAWLPKTEDARFLLRLLLSESALLLGVLVTLASVFRFCRSRPSIKPALEAARARVGLVEEEAKHVLRLPEGIDRCLPSTLSKALAFLTILSVIGVWAGYRYLLPASLLPAIEASGFLRLLLLEFVMLMGGLATLLSVVRDCTSSPNAKRAWEAAQRTNKRG